MNTSQDSAGPTLLRMAAPLMVSFVMRAAFTFVDTAYAATIGDAAVAAIGLTVPFEFLMIATFVGLSTGLTSALSRSMGSKEGQKTKQYLRATLVMVWIISPAFLLLGVLIGFATPQFGLDDNVYQSFRIYAGVLLGGSAITAFWSVIPDSIIKSHQDTKSVMWAGIWSNVLNVSLNTLFLFVFHWGIFGIALSTVIGRLGGLVYASIKASQHEARRLASGEHTRPGTDPSPYRPILSLAVPASLTFVLSAVELLIVNTLLATLDNATQVIAAYSIYHRVTLFAFNPIIAVAVATLPYAGRKIGCMDFEGLRRGVRQAMTASTVYSLFLVAPLIVLFGPWLAGALAESEQTARFATFALYLAPLSCLALTPFNVYRPVFEAMGQGRPGLAMAAIRVLVLTVPASMLGLRVAESMGQPSVFGLVMALLVVQVLTSSVFSYWLRGALNRHERHLLEQPVKSTTPTLEPGHERSGDRFDCG